MKRETRMQLTFGLVVLLGGGGFLGAEYFLVKWYPRHQQRETEETLKLLPYGNPALGLEMEVAAGIYGKVDEFPGGVRITRPKFWGIGPSLTITSLPNPDGTAEFSPEILAKWQTQGTYEELPRYHFEHAKINNRDAVLIRQFKGRWLVVTARVISPERIIEAHCTPAQGEEALFMQACDSSLRTIKVAGPYPPPPPPPVLELSPPRSRSASRR